MVIQNNIQESYCSFHVSKLLKEKGYLVCPNRVYYDVNGKEHVCQIYSYTWKQLKIGKGTDIIKPTHALAIDWIWINFGIWISIYPATHTNNLFVGCVYKSDGTVYKDVGNTPQQATEAILSYVLNKLI